MIVDTHVHFNEPHAADKPPAQDANPMPHLDVDELLARARAAGVDRIVQVTPSTMGYDNAYSFAMARRYKEIVGVIARFDPAAPGAGATLQALAEEPETLGVRMTLITPRTENGLKERSFEDLFGIAQDRGIWIELFAPFRVEEMHEAVKRFPRVRWLIDHMGLQVKTGRIDRDTFRQWPALLALAKEPNVWIKASYFPEAAMYVESYPYPAAQARFRELYEAAGAKKLVWGSNFPPVTRTCSYAEAVDFVRKECTFLTQADREAIMGGNFLEAFVPERTRREL